MYVLMDLEWVENKMGHIGPTQMAALRVDEHWNTIDAFYAKMRPRDPSFHQWDHVAYAGGAPEEFLRAESAFSEFSKLRGWLLPDDVLCWWYEAPCAVFKRLYFLLLKEKCNRHNCILADYVERHLAGGQPCRGNPYKLASAYGIAVHSIMHDSANDVQAMQSVLRGIQFPQTKLKKPVPKPAKEPKRAPRPLPYQYEVETGLIHKLGCAYIREGAALRGQETLKTSLRRGYRHCPHCLAAEYKAALRERTRDMIARSQFNFVYTPGSEVFHRHDCGLILPARVIQGSIHYEKCADTGRRPCKVCRPAPDDPLRPVATLRTKKKTIYLMNRPKPPEREWAAYLRFKQARAERQSRLQAEGLTEAERQDIYTLTMTRYGFFAGAGYQNFHLRNCPKLKNLSNIRGFSRCQEAMLAGLTPCKCCKPTPKDDVNFSIPIRSARREEESLTDLEALCVQNGFPFEAKREFFTIRTPVGRWRIHLDTMPIAVDHLNLTKTPDNPHLYHRQPRLFLSLLDTFQYIRNHDRNLQTQHSRF